MARASRPLTRRRQCSNQSGKGWLADRLGGYRLLVLLLFGFSICSAWVGTLPSAPLAVGLLVVGMGLLGMGNGAVFQLVPQRFPDRIGLVTGVVGAAGGLGGFFLPSVFGAVRDATGSYSAGLLGCAMVFLAGTVVLLELGSRWSAQWERQALRRAGVFSYRAVWLGFDDERAA